MFLEHVWEKFWHHGGPQRGVHFPDMFIKNTNFYYLIFFFNGWGVGADVSRRFGSQDNRNFRKSWKIGKFSDFSENFPQLQIFQIVKFWKKTFRFFQTGKFSICKCWNSSDFIGKNSTFSIRSGNWHTYRARRIKFRNFRRSWKSGKFSDLSKKFPQLQIFQFVKFWKKIFWFFQIGKFSTFSIRAETSHISTTLGRQRFSFRGINFLKFWWTCLGNVPPSGDHHGVKFFPGMFNEHVWEIENVWWDLETMKYFSQTCSLNMSGKNFDTMWVPEGGYISQTCSSKFEKIYPPKGKALPSQSGRNVQCFNQNGEGGKFSDLEKSENFLPKFDELEYLQLRKIFR